MLSKLHGPGYGESIVSTMVAGGAMTAMGYGGIAVFNPYNHISSIQLKRVYNLTKDN